MNERISIDGFSIKKEGLDFKPSVFTSFIISCRAWNLLSDVQVNKYCSWIACYIQGNQWIF